MEEFAVELWEPYEGWIKYFVRRPLTSVTQAKRYVHLHNDLIAKRSEYDPKYAERPVRVIIQVA